MAVKLALALVFFTSVAQANFVADPTRVESKGFAKFFFKKFDASFGNELRSLHFGLKPADQAYVNHFIGKVQRIGLKARGGVLGSLEYHFHFLNSARDPKAVPSEGPFRFIDFDRDADLRKEALTLIKLKAPTFDQHLLEGFQLGLGFFPEKADFEILVWEPHLKSSQLISRFAPALVAKVEADSEGEIVLVFEKGKVVRTEVRELGLKAPFTSPPVVRLGSTDRILESDGSVRWLFHPEQFEDQAIDPAGRIYSEKIRAITNLIPGAIEWKSYNDYAFIYP